MDLLTSEFVRQFHFLRPLWLLALLPALLLFLLIRVAHQNKSNWSRAIDPVLLPYLLEKNQFPGRNRVLYAVLGMWSLAILALAGPAWRQIPVPVQEREDTLVIVQDLSLSMFATDLSPNRVTRAQRKIMDILNKRSQEGQTALVVYAGDAHTVIPLTDDVETIRNLVPVLSPDIMPVMGSKPALGIATAVELLANSAVTRAQILLITDGINRNDIPLIQEALEGSTHTLSVLGIGTEQGAPIPVSGGGFLRDQQNAIVIPRLESAVLQELITIVRGRYSDAALTDTDIDYLLDQSIFEKTENLVASTREFDDWHEEGPWLLLLLLPIAALSFRQGWLLSICALALVLPPRQAFAWEWQDLWMRKDQQAARVFTEENYEQAASLFKSDSWRAAANYKSGNYEQALQDLALLETPDAYYNRGNTLARLGHLEEAIAAYDQALALAPEHEDARHNKEIVEALLQQQQENQQQQSEQNSGENQDKQESEQNQKSEQQGKQQDDSQQQSADQENQQNQQDSQKQDSQQQAQENEQQQDPAQSSEGQQPDSEEEQAMQQWLQRIPDDPGELLRNKFQYQSQERLLQQLRNPDLTEQQAGQPW
ncbi:MAG: VWA domain-containing protein [Pseudomonadales bacterium]|nr:VWA domain-containing protein [Pseudomonadales bacterium]